MNDRVHDSIVEEAVRDETERCALLCVMRGDISRASAAKLRKDGSYTVRAIWPPFKKMTVVAPKWERNARLCEDVGHAFDVVADCIRKGYDPRDRKPSPEERIDIPCATCDTSCGDASSCARPRVHPAPTTDAERLDALRKANGLDV